MKVAILILSIFSVVGSLLPIWSNPHWIIRGQMNLRPLYLVINLICLIAVIAVLPFDYWKIFLISSLILSISICLKSIWPYTVLSNIEIRNASKELPNHQVKIFVFNVYQPNDKIELLIASIRKKDPDIILLLETNDKWDKGLNALHDTYPYHVKAIREDTYGLLLLSRIPFTSSQIQYLIYNGIPSVEVMFTIGHKVVRLMGLHPEPPIWGERSTSVKKDEEILAAASYLSTKSKDESHLLLGDLNEVAWSDTSSTFRKITNMKDPRVGRGMFATFPAYSPIKFPLDHIYCTPDFELIEYSILDSMGSDHHAIFIHFQLQPKNH